MLKNIVLDHSKNLLSAGDIIRYETSYKFEGKAVTSDEAFYLKTKGLTIGYPRTNTHYNYIIDNEACVPGKNINEKNSKNIHICIVGDYNVAYPQRNTLDVLAVLIRGLIEKYSSLTKERVLPLRYFKKNCDGPGLLFNTRRFVKEYL